MPGEKVTAGALQDRVRRFEGKKNGESPNRSSTQNCDESSGDSGDKPITVEEVVERVEKLVEEKGMSQRKAAEVVAEQVGYADFF